MSYSRETYDIAVAEIARRKNEAEHKAYETKEKFLSIHPEGRILLDRIASAGSRAAIAVLKGGNAKEELMRLRDENLHCQKLFDDLLATEGLTRADIHPKYSCEKCGDTGYVDGYMCSCLKDAMKATAFNALNKVSPLQLSTFESFSTKYYEGLPESQRDMMVRNFEFCKSYGYNFSMNSGNILFQGTTGLGKTHLSLAIAGKAIEKGYGVVYGSVHSFATAIEKERFASGEGEDTASLLSTADLLILDDLGTEFPSPYVNASLYNIIDTRIMRNLPTIISSNLTAEDIQKRYGERLVSRLFSCFTRLVFTGKDVRIMKKKLGQ